MESGRTRAELESKGEVIGNKDLWIAAHALAAGLTLVTNNVTPEDPKLLPSGADNIPVDEARQDG